jgi:hypothetical protein
VRAFGLRYLKPALGTLQVRFRTFHLRLRRQILALGVIHFLLSHQAGFGFRDAV